MVYYLYKIYFKNGAKTELYLLDITKSEVLSYITNNESKAYNTRIINWGEVQSVKCHELKDEVLTKIVNGIDQIMNADNE